MALGTWHLALGAGCVAIVSESLEVGPEAVCTLLCTEYSRVCVLQSNLEYSESVSSPPGDRGVCKLGMNDRAERCTS